MNDLLGFFTDVTVAAAVTTASHFGLAIEGTEPRTANVEAHRTVRRTAVGSSSARPAPRTVRTPIR